MHWSEELSFYSLVFTLGVTIGVSLGKEAPIG